MKFLFLRSQPVDVEFAVGGGRLADGNLDFHGRRRRLGARSGDWGWRWLENCGVRFWDTFCRTGGDRWGLRSDTANGLRNLFFQWAARTGLQGQCREARKDIEGRGERCGSRLRAKHGWKGVSGLAAGAGGDDVVNGLLEFFASALDALEIIAKGAGDGLFHSVGFRCHADMKGCFARFSPVLPLWRGGERASTGRGRGVSNWVMRSWKERC